MLGGAGGLARARTPLPRRRQPRAADAADRADRQRRVPRPPWRRPGGDRRPAERRPAPAPADRRPARRSSARAAPRRPSEPVRLERDGAPSSARGSPDVELRVEGTGDGDRRARRARAQLFENLLENAAVHGPAGGRIEIAMEVADGERRGRGQRRGRGLPAGQRGGRLRALLARPRRRASAPGSGIGLAIVKATAERHGGSVRARGLDGDGDAAGRRQRGSLSGSPPSSRRPSLSRSRRRGQNQSPQDKRPAGAREDSDGHEQSPAPASRAARRESRLNPLLPPAPRPPRRGCVAAASSTR